MNSLFLEGLESARRIVKEKGINALDDLIEELKADYRETAIANHPSNLEKR